MKKLISIAAAIAFAMIPAAAMAILPDTPLALDALIKNTDAKPIAVIGFCNATATPADLEGWVGKKKPSENYQLELVASESGTGRKSITLIIPPGWFYKVLLTGGPANSACKVTGWPLQ